MATLTDVKIASEVETLAGTIADVETKTVGKILGNVEVEALADNSPDTLSQVVAKRIANTVTCVKAKALVINR